MYFTLSLCVLQYNNIPTQEYHVILRLVHTRLELLQHKALQQLIDDFVFEMTEMESKVILTQKHLIQLEHVFLPESLLKLRKDIHNFLNTRLLYRHRRHHGISRSRTMVNMRHDRLKPKYLPLTIGLFVYRVLIYKFNLTIALEDEVKVFGDLPAL